MSDCRPESLAHDTVEAEPIAFAARLFPHCSLSHRGFLILMTAITIVSFVAGLAFYLAGAWPVVGFFGLDVLLIYVAFKVNMSRARYSETIHLTASALEIERRDHHGNIKAWRFNPAWVQVLVVLEGRPAGDQDDGDPYQLHPERHDRHLVLRSHGKSVHLGSCLTAGEVEDLAGRLRAALDGLRKQRYPREEK
jgi:uncharacterized membrane protein